MMPKFMEMTLEHVGRLLTDEGMLSCCFKDSPFLAVNAVYPNKFKPWEFSSIPNGYWNDINNGIEATKWLIEEKLQLTETEIKQLLSVQLFEINGLRSMLGICFKDSPFQAVDAVYPNRFKPWEFKKVPNSYWEDVNNAISATKWLIEEKLKLSEEELKKRLSIQLFQDYGLRGMLSNCFNDSPFKAIDAVYPGKYRISEFKNCNYYK